MLMIVSLISLNTMAMASVTSKSKVAQKAAAEMKAKDTRTIIRDVTNTDGNPCMPEGKSYQVDLQVKQASFNHETNDVDYTWETVKTIGVDKAGHVMEVCAE